MSNDQHEEDDREAPDDLDYVESHTGADSDIENRLEALAGDIAAVIGESPSQDREALHDYAVSLVREQLPVAEDDDRYGAPREVEAGPSNGGRNVGIAYGFLILLVAPLLLLVFPPVGMMLLLIGVAMVLWGVVAGFVARFKPQPLADED